MATSRTSTVKFKLTATKDRAAWNLTGATVTLLLIDPDGTVTTKTATVEDASNGIASYTTLTTDITAPGKWQRRWRVVQSSVDITSQPIPFDVTP